MDDVDVLVPIERSDRRDRGAERRRGWSTRSARMPQAWTEVHHSLGFAGAGRRQRRSALVLPSGSRLATMPLWRAAVPLELAGARDARALPGRPAAARLRSRHALEPAAARSAGSPTRSTVIRSAGEGLDWDRLAAEAERRRLTVATAAALGYLREEFGARGAAMPSSIGLRAAPASRHERAAFRAACQPDSPAAHAAHGLGPLPAPARSRYRRAPTRRLRLLRAPLLGARQRLAAAAARGGGRSAGGASAMALDPPLERAEEARRGRRPHPE